MPTSSWDDDDDMDDLDQHEDPDPADQDPDDTLADEDGDSQTEPCPYCGRQVYVEADICPHCGSFVNFDAARPRRSLWWILALAAALAAVLLYTLR